MKKDLSGQLVFSPSDLICYLASPFASWMDRYALENPGAGWLVGGTTRVLAVNPLPVEACDG